MKNVLERKLESLYNKCNDDNIASKLKDMLESLDFNSEPKSIVDKRKNLDNMSLLMTKFSKITELSNAKLATGLVDIKFHIELISVNSLMIEMLNDIIEINKKEMN